MRSLIERVLEPNAASWRAVLFFCLINAGAAVNSSATLNGQSIENQMVPKQLLKSLEKHAIGRDEVFVGIGGRESDNLQLGQRTSAPRTFDQLAWNVWREQWQSEQGQAVKIRDGDACFMAVKFGAGKFRFRQLRMADHAEKNRRLSMLAGRAATEVLGNRLGEYLKIEGTTVEMLDAPDYLGRRVEGVKLLSPYVRGTILWLPDNGYLIRKAQLYMEKPAKVKGRKIEDVVVDYQEFQGRLVPARIESRLGTEPNVTIIDQLRPANPDRQYYTAQSIGLELPARPVRSWIYWAIAATVLFACFLIVRGRFG